MDSQTCLLSSSKFSIHTAHLSVSPSSPQFLVPLHHRRVFRQKARRERSAMARVVVDGMPETAVGGGVMLNRRRSKARRRKRKELFAVQMCFAGVLLGLVVGIQCVAQKAGHASFVRQIMFFKMHM
ncbi:sodium/potassium/calcium exchanger 3-like protein [Lates japonicus]|uniref:Sodium/potassium/calcium exchanger 3-like protein n=1 Tax=Lates japonicus TaxID=270547 RepID=A0AAD3RE16_LATJO|nr:sodium/potassium/calcium exchanger 3-like protein [Lates japonicus]